MYSASDDYVLLQVNQDGVTTSEPMDLEKITELVIERYKEQPLQYFNEYKRIKVVHLKTGTIKEAKLTIEF